MTKLGRRLVAVLALACNEPREGGQTGGLEPCLEQATVQANANPTSVQVGQSSVVSWGVNAPGECRIEVFLDGAAVARSGTVTVSPPASKDYLLVVRLAGNAVSQKSATARVQVIPPTTVDIDRETEMAEDKLVDGLSDTMNEGVTVVLGCDVDLDLTGRPMIAIEADHRSIVAKAGCERTPDRRGPRIRVKDKRSISKPLFLVRGDHFKMSGFRLEGPTTDIGEGDDNKEFGMKIRPKNLPTPLEKIEISNMEISNWSGGGIYIQDVGEPGVAPGRLVNTRVDAIRISNSFFHHNRHDHGYGYGIDVTNGAYALIERNVFNENRHAISGGSRFENDVTGYTARENLIGTGGGSHCRAWVICWNTHQFDMHGDQDCTFLGSGSCGIAGETILIERNTFLYTLGHAIKIRGNPVDKVVVDENIFRHESQSDAIAQNGDDGMIWRNITNPIVVNENNVFNHNPSDESWRCDFTGDGKPDRFMATGVTWWAMSGETGHHWYLNSMKERVGELEFGDFDGDGVCDVAPKRMRRRPTVAPPERYSRRGTTPWIPFVAPPR